MKPLWLLDPASPGMKVLVFRNWLQRLLYSKDFATLGEAIFYCKYCMIIRGR